MRKKEVILINPFYNIAGDSAGAVTPPLSLMYIASVLEQDGHSAGIVDARLGQLDVDQTVSAVRSRNERPLLIGIYINTLNQKVCGSLVAGLRDAFRGSVIAVGGPAPTSVPGRILDDIRPDYLVRGEGEFAVRDLVRRIKGRSGEVVRDIPGVIPQDKSAPLSTKAARITNLDDLPPPSYHLLEDIKKYSSSGRGRPFATMITSRGCQYTCDFCSKDVFGSSVTRRSTSNIISEIDGLVGRYGVRQIDFVDDNLAHNRRHFEALLDEILKRDYKIWFNLTSGIRSEILDEALLSKMRKARFYSLAFGIESADQALLDLHNKHMNIKLMREKIALAKRHGFFIHGFFIIGLPGESEESFQKTLDFIREAGVDMPAFCMAVPFPGTKMLAMVKDNGKLLIDVEGGIDEGFYGSKCFFSYPGLEPEDVIRRYKTAYSQIFTPKRTLRLFVHYRGNRWFVKNGITVVNNMIKSRFSKSYA